MSEYKTLREASIAMDGIGDQLSLYAKVFTVFVAVALGVTGFFYLKLDKVEEASVRIETELKAVNTNIGDMKSELSGIKRLLAEVRDNTKQASLDVPIASGDETASGSGYSIYVTGPDGKAKLVAAGEGMKDVGGWYAERLVSPSKFEEITKQIQDAATAGKQDDIWLIRPVKQ